MRNNSIGCVAFVVLIVLFYRFLGGPIANMWADLCVENGGCNLSPDLISFCCTGLVAVFIIGIFVRLRG